MRNKPYTRRGVVSALAAAVVAAAMTLVAQVAISQHSPASAAGVGAVQLEERPDRRRRLRPRHHLQPDRAQPDLRPHRHRRRLPVERGRPELDRRCWTGSGWDNWGYNGVLSIATDPVRPNRVYAAVGMYTNSWDPNNGAILRSTDKGATWQVDRRCRSSSAATCPAAAWASGSRSTRTATAIVYFARRGGNGLWRSTDSGATWAKVTSFPNAGNYVAGPGDPTGTSADNQGVVVGDLRQVAPAPPATPPRRIYVGVADKQNTVYRSTNGGTTWERIAGQPTGYLPHKGVFDHGQPASSTSPPATPAARTTAARATSGSTTPRTGTWTQISPIPSSSADDYFGYSGLTIDRQNPNTHHGGHPDLLVAGRDLLPQHRRRRHLDPDLGLRPATPTGPSATRWTSRLGAVADLRRQPAAAGGDARSWAG